MIRDPQRMSQTLYPSRAARWGQRFQVWTSPVRFREENLLIIPLLSWYHPEFDQEPELPDSSWPSRRHSRLALLGDEMECSWPAPVPSGTGATASAARNLALAKIFDAMNDSREVTNLGAPCDAAHHVGVAQGITRGAKRRVDEKVLPGGGQDQTQGIH
eukprot:Skav221102  [mRNA]  locus=scaffold693:201379:218863:- [translate_table: standard]